MGAAVAVGVRGRFTTGSLSTSGRARRVPGLRREEVARLADVSTDYYTRLEQGRHPRVSESVLDGVARALRLGPAERDHHFDLARPRATHPSRDRPRPERVRPEVHQTLEVLGSVSLAFIVKHRLDVLISNHLARALITDFDALATRERNFARFVLFSPAAKELYGDREAITPIIVANLRRSSGRHPDDTRLNELIGEACVKVTEFNGWWAGHHLGDCSYGAQRFHHAVVGDLTLHHEALNLATDPDQTICLYTAESGSSSAQTLALLASWSAPHVSAGTRSSDSSGRRVMADPGAGRTTSQE
ncbi:helix-turn-helix transcriptional regulator [Streptomyces pseudovenezuelae]|uniref:Transcriptional regulator with XRE-family HTH domain n=1 Tax=Streptomyces pseudovenezuelae TaxID=67350 RepID=A0ABT6LDG6_9ACTN|nr:helix-turn-helix transcriptional regulator [Streptomyces pseudovenezuelae]MDH6214347.1 transcriptional regulator with XRE-family HTH domain [Streptomyces pseudovenezuelae]